MLARLFLYQETLRRAEATGGDEPPSNNLHLANEGIREGNAADLIVLANDRFARHERSFNTGIGA
jgi:hypothetical protein